MQEKGRHCPPYKRVVPSTKTGHPFYEGVFYVVHWKEMVKKDRIVNSARAKESP